MPKAGKVWGETEEIFNNGVVSVNHLKIKKGGYCSEHYHKKKSNMFFVISGNLLVRVWRADGISEISDIIVDETVMRPGESTTVLPGITHQFSAQTDVECFEIYSLMGMSEDIFRRTAGGMKKK